VVGPQLEVWPGAARDPRRRGTRPGAGCEDRPLKATCLRHLGALRRHAWWPVGLLYRVDLSAIRLQRTLRRIHRVASFLGRYRHALRADPRRLALDSGPAVLRGGHQPDWLVSRDVWRAVPRRDFAAALGHHPDCAQTLDTADRSAGAFPGRHQRPTRRSAKTRGGG